MRLPDFEAWAIFASVVEHRSFTAAAAALGVSKATVSKAVTRLETDVRTALFHRSSRRLTLTESGKALMPRARRLLDDAEAIEEAARVDAGEPSGTVRVTAPMSFGLSHVAPAIAEFLAAHPAITIDLHLSDEQVDIVEQGFDMALRIAALPDSSLRARRIGDVPAHIVAAPSYLAAHGTPTHPARLAEHRCIIYTNLLNPELWRFRGPEGELVAVRLAGPLRCNSGDAMLPALRAGLGIARLPGFIVDAEFAAGRLVTLLESWSGEPVGLHLVSPPGRHRPARVTALIDHLVERLADACHARQ